MGGHHLEILGEELAGYLAWPEEVDVAGDCLPHPAVEVAKGDKQQILLVLEGDKGGDELKVPGGNWLEKLPGPRPLRELR